MSRISRPDDHVSCRDAPQVTVLGQHLKIALIALAPIGTEVVPREL